MVVLHADLVGPQPEGRNCRNQWGFQYILSLVDLAIHYLWLLPLCHKTTEAVALAFFDKVISRVQSICPIHYFDGLRGEFTVEVVECLQEDRNHPPLDLSLPSPNGC